MNGNEVQDHFLPVWQILGMILAGAGGLVGVYVALVAQMKTIVRDHVDGLKDHLDKELASLERRVTRVEDVIMRGVNPSEE